MACAQAAAGLGDALCYEDIIAAEKPNLAGFQWVRVHENDACGLCYTSGTTGRPKVRCPDALLSRHRAPLTNTLSGCFLGKLTESRIWARACFLGT